MNTKKALGLLLSLACGVALGYLIPRGGTSDSNSENTTTKITRANAPKTVQGDPEKDLNRLRKQIDELKGQNADLQKQLADKGKQTDATSDNTEGQRQAGGRRWNNFWRSPTSPADARAMADELRKNNPEMYAQMTNRFASMRAHQAERAQRKIDILDSVDVSWLSSKQAQVHEQYRSLIQQQEELNSKAFAPDDGSVSDADRMAAFGKMWQVGQELHNVAQQEREILLNQTARSFGVKGEAGKELVETVKQVYQATESWGGHGRGGRGGGRGGPPGPPSPGR